MQRDAIRAVVESFYADVWNRHDKSRIPALLSPQFTFRGSLGDLKRGHDGFAAYLDFVHATFEHFRCDIVDLVIESPRAFARMRFSGIHRAEVFGFAPTGKPVEWAGAALFTFSDATVVDLWVLGDLRGLCETLERHSGREPSG